ncbi:MAG TPA: LuxR C-terminal-related transcriptional regulator [Pseudolabrys sp.]|nr:LuxR C-terminal-related transcriptional regulator [Pseudolabrys sp.]
MIVCRASQKITSAFLPLDQSNSEEKADFIVSVVGNDPRLRMLARLVEGSGYPVQGYSSAADFIGQRGPNTSGCVVVDLQSPNVFTLQDTLAREEPPPPIIFISEANDFVASVQAMKAGAFDVLTKPADRKSLLCSISLALKRYAKARHEHQKRSTIRRKFATLTKREIEVLRHVIAGKLNKEIAFALGTVEKTIKVHRSRAARKLGAHSVVELLRLASMAGVTPYVTDNN